MQLYSARVRATLRGLLVSRVPEPFSRAVSAPYAAVGVAQPSNFVDHRSARTGHTAAVGPGDVLRTSKTGIARLRRPTVGTLCRKVIST